MAAQLAGAGWSLLLNDAERTAANRAAGETGAEAVPLVRLRGCPVVILMLPNSDAVRGTLLGEQGLLAGLRPGSVVVDMGSSAPSSTAELAATAARSGVHLVDAPVSGGVAKAATGQLSIMAGGEPAAFKTIQPLLEQIGSRITVVGKVGAGHALKALNNLLSAVGLVAAAEVLLVGQQFGIDPTLMLGVLNNSTGRNNSTEIKYASFVLSGKFNSGFSAALMVKDLRTAIDLAHSTGVPVALGAACLELCTAALASLPPGADHTAVVRFLEDASGGLLRANNTTIPSADVPVVGADTADRS
jgi:3-hydroxyisobutyrate dehydrogenase